jgi:hypothetical protein
MLPTLVPVHIGVEAHYSVVHPDNVPSNERDIRLFIIPAAPTVMFNWV